MSAMKMPGFTGEVSLYRTNNHYRSGAGSVVLSGNANLIPQGCGVWQTVKCLGFTGAALAGCGLLCVGSPPVVCYGCLIGVGGLASYIDCKDCLPGWLRAILDLFESGGGNGGTGGGGGGGGGPKKGPCGCPLGTKCCGGCTKIPGQGLVCNGDCVAPNESCLA
jgi:hypothetical protein